MQHVVNRRGLPNGMRHTKSLSARRWKPHILLAVPTICRTPSNTRTKTRRSAHHSKKTHLQFTPIHTIRTHQSSYIYIYIYIYRGAEAWGILGVNSPHFFELTPPTSWRDLKMGVRERECSKNFGGVEKN